MERARDVFRKGIEHFRKEEPELKEERVLLLENWLALEKKDGDEESVQNVKEMMPKKVKKRRKLKLTNPETGEETNEDGGKRLLKRWRCLCDVVSLLIFAGIM